MNVDTINNEFYNQYHDHFDQVPFEKELLPLIEKYLPSQCEILEIGSGAGALALWMTNKGFKVTCIEPAELPAEKARSKGLKVFSTKFQDFTSEKTYKGILAISSLIHISRSEMPSQIKKISQILETGGYFIVSFIEGEGEGYEDPTKKGKLRFFSKFTLDELKVLLEPYFSIIEVRKIEVKKMNQSFFLFALKALNNGF